MSRSTSITDGRHTIPVNKSALRVVTPGIHFIPETKAVSGVHEMSRDPLPMKHPSLMDRVQRGIVGLTFGRFRVIGVGTVKNCDDKALYVCRCACGMYEHRTARAIRNPKNNHDACQECRLIALRRRQALWKFTGVEKGNEDFL